MEEVIEISIITRAVLKVAEINRTLLVELESFIERNPAEQSNITRLVILQSEIL